MISKQMGKKVKILVPSIWDDPIVGRTIVPIMTSLFPDFMMIDDDKLTFKKETFDLKTIDRLLLVKTEVTPWTADHKLDSAGLIGTAMELYLVDRSGERHILIPRFIMNANNYGLKRWNRFLYELSVHSGLPIKQIYKPSRPWKDNNQRL